MPGILRRSKAQRTPTGRGRVTPRQSGRYTPPIPRAKKVSPRWVPVLLLTLLISACSREKASPFDLWDMRAGMPFAKLDSIAVHDQQERFTCIASVGKFKECVLAPHAIPSRMVAIVDSANRAVIISFHPDTHSLGSSDGASVVIETERLRRRWKRRLELMRRSKRRMWRCAFGTVRRPKRTFLARC